MANRDTILDAAERLLGRYGYRKMTIDDIAAEAGIGKGTVYLSFTSKEEIVLSTVDRIVDRVCETMHAELERAQPAAERLRRMLEARVVIRFESVREYSASLNDLLSSVRAALLERRQKHFEREADLLARAIRHGQKGGEIVSGAAPRYARALLSATNTFLPYSLSPRELGDEQTLRRDAADVIRLLVRALANAAHSKN